MPVNAIAENVFGTLGTVCWMVQLFPQIYKSYQEKNTVGLSDLMILSWALGGVFLGIYAVVQNLNIPLIMQPQIFGTLSVICWAQVRAWQFCIMTQILEFRFGKLITFDHFSLSTQCQYYRRRWSPLKTIIVGSSLWFVFGGFEAGMVYALRSPYDHGNKHAESAISFFGIMSTVVITGALVPQYYQIYKYKEVVGLSIPCMTIDLLGGVFSDLSLIFRPGSFNVLAGITYSLVVVTDGAVIVAAVILNPRARKARRRTMVEMEQNTGQPTTMEDRALPTSPLTSVVVITGDEVAEDHVLDRDKVLRHDENEGKLDTPIVHCT
ncbi:PQ loop repeat-domain-containing protein [Lentinula detonsa]|uniref:PQ loop repeat-domain-containing protein n=1 Tax=Lentinula detonsa TaxID=2804962 RepID=A0AA38PQD5_9AGAR|nr:PQ loop repeat-domain-containing protein [Lentinula detonsa]